MILFFKDVNTGSATGSTFLFEVPTAWSPEAALTGQLAQLSKRQLRFMLTPGSLFDVQHGIIKLESIRAHDLSLYSWNESSRMWTILKNQIRIHGNMLDMQPGPADDGYCTCPILFWRPFWGSLSFFEGLFRDNLNKKPRDPSELTTCRYSRIYQSRYHIVPEQYSIQKEYPKHSVSRKNLFLYSNLRNNFQTNQKLGAFWEKMFLLFSNGVIFTQPCHFQEVFGRYLWNGPSTLKIEKSHF